MLRNEIDKKPSPIPCTHGSWLHECTDQNCREIWELTEEQLQEENQEKALAILAQKRTAELGDDEDGAEQEKKASALDHKDAEEWDHQENGGGAKYRHGLPFDHIMIKAMLQYGALNDRQAKIAHRMVDLSSKPRLKIWPEIANELGCSAKTVQREIQRIGKALSKKPPRQIYPPGSILVIKRQGQRNAEYWRTHEVRFRNWRHTWREPLTSRCKLRDLVKGEQPIIRWTVKHNDSPMQRFFGALMMELAGNPPRKDGSDAIRWSDINWHRSEVKISGKKTDGPKIWASLTPAALKTLRDRFESPDRDITSPYVFPSPKPAAWPPEEFFNNWSFNIAKAREIVTRRTKSTGPWTVKQIYLALAKESLLCKSCQSPMIVGIRFKGSLITRGKESCDNACKQRFHRRSRK